MKANEIEKARRPSFMVQQDVKAKSGKEKKKNLDDLKKEIVMNDHKMKLDELIKLYETHIDNGLTNAKHKELLAKHGLNKLTPPKQTPEWVKLFQQMTNGFAKVN
jgi:sodium/potassium-transporting ATPase subunit alpha